MRTYDVAVASLAIDAPAKWTDNLLSHHAVPGVVAEQRGVARRIPYDALRFLAVARELHVRLRLGVRDAVEMAAALLSNDEGVVHPGGHLRVSLDRSGLERELDVRLRDALESAPAPRRGRPPIRRSGVTRRKRGGTVD